MSRCSFLGFSLRLISLISLTLHRSFSHSYLSVSLFVSFSLVSLPRSLSLSLSCSLSLSFSLSLSLALFLSLSFYKTAHALQLCKSLNVTELNSHESAGPHTSHNVPFTSHNPCSFGCPPLSHAGGTCQPELAKRFSKPFRPPKLWSALLRSYTSQCSRASERRQASVLRCPVFVLRPVHANIPKA